MINKIYEKIKMFIKENYKELIFLIILFIVINYPVDYSIMISGGTINVNDRVEIKNQSESKGSFNLAYVTELKGTIPTFLLSYIIPNWSRVGIEEYQASSKETTEDITKRARLYLLQSEQAAIKLAYEKAGADIKVTDYSFNVVYVDEEIQSNIKIGDILLEVNNRPIDDMAIYREELESSEVGDILNIKLKRNSKIINTKLEVRNIEGNKLTGISVLPLYEYETDPEIDLNFKSNESGSSGGLMLTLSIYDKLVDKDLTNGLKIVGTGTIDFEGNIGEIDGVKYKLMGAVNEKADLFIVPDGDNYQECLELKSRRGYNIEIIPVKTFEEALTKLEMLANKK